MPSGRFYTRDGLSVKIDGKQMDMVRRIVHSKLRPFHFQIKTHYLSDANYRQRINRLRGIIRLSQCEYGQQLRSVCDCNSRGQTQKGEKLTFAAQASSEDCGLWAVYTTNRRANDPETSIKHEQLPLTTSELISGFNRLNGTFICVRTRCKIRMSFHSQREHILGPKWYFSHLIYHHITELYCTGRMTLGGETSAPLFIQCVMWSRTDTSFFPRFRCAWRQVKVSFLQTGNPIFFP